jgi:small subunit ribosomal protein S8
MMTDPIADFLTRVRNALRIEAPSVKIPYSKIKEEICKVLVEEGYFVQYVKDKRDDEPRAHLLIQLKYGPSGEQLVQSIDRVSKPGCRVYKAAKELRPVLGGMGVAVVSTSQGVMSDRQARTRGVGGEVICQVY